MTTALSAPMPLGHKNAADTQSERRLGEVFTFRDTDVVNGQLVREQRGEGVMARLVKCTFAGTPGNAVGWTDDKFGTEVGAVAADNTRIAGILDPYLTSISANDIVWLIIGGPIDAITGAAITTQYIQGAGSGKIKGAAFDTDRDELSGRILEDGDSKSDGDTIRVHLFPESPC